MLLKINYLSQALQMQTNVTVVLPSFTFADAMNGHAESYVPGTKFQVLYLLHGGFGDDSDYVNFTNVVRYADDHKLAVIMPNGYNSMYEDGQPGLLSSRYWQYVSEELPRVCEAMFPISTEREDTFAAGLSMGAHGAMRLASLKADRFRTVLLMSGTAMQVPEQQSGAGLGPAGALTAIGSRLRPEVRPDSEVYERAVENVRQGVRIPDLIMTCGDKDFVLEPVRTSRDLLRSIGYSVEYEEVPGYGHEWDFWDLSLRKAFEQWLPIRHEVITPA